MHHGLTRAPGLLSAEERKEIMAILRHGRSQWEPDQSGEGSHEIDLADQLVTYATGLHHAGPANDHRDAMSAFPEIALQAAQRPHAAMAKLPHPFESKTLRAIVAG